MAAQKMDLHFKSTTSTSEFTFKWTVNDFHTFKTNRPENSCYFYPEGACKWWASVEKCGDKLKFKLFRSEKFGKIVVQSNVTVKGANGKVFLNSAKIFNFDNTPGSKTLFSELKIGSENLKRADFSLDIELQLKMQKKKFLAVYGQQTNRNVRCESCKDWMKLYASKVATDFNLLVEGDKIGVHKEILCSKSPIFSKMFDGKQNFAKIDDIRMPIMNELVDFMYNEATLDYDFETAMEVYYAADKYGVTELTDKSRDILKSKINVENALKLLRFADRHNDLPLKERVKNFIFDNMKSFVKTDWWREVMKSRNELEDFIAQKLNPN